MWLTLCCDRRNICASISHRLCIPNLREQRNKQHACKDKQRDAQREKQMSKHEVGWESNKQAAWPAAMLNDSIASLLRADLVAAVLDPPSLCIFARDRRNTIGPCDPDEPPNPADDGHNPKQQQQQHRSSSDDGERQRETARQTGRGAHRRTMMCRSEDQDRIGIVIQSEFISHHSEQRRRRNEQCERDAARSVVAVRDASELAAGTRVLLAARLLRACCFSRCVWMRT